MSEKETVGNRPLAPYDVEVLKITGADVQVFSQLALDSLIDKASVTIEYYGFALPGTPSNSPTWRILRKEVSGTVSAFRYADGISGFTRTWDDRASYDYQDL